MNMLAFMLASAPAAAPDVDVGGEIVRVILSLLGIIALILAAGWLNRRLQHRSGATGRRIRCVETFSVGTRERLLLLDADGKRLLLGVGPGGMHTLHVYEDRTAGADAPPQSSTAGFGELLARWKRSP